MKILVIDCIFHIQNCLPLGMVQATGKVIVLKVILSSSITLNIIFSEGVLKVMLE